MGSSFSWLDSSERERRRTLDVLSMFADRDTRDELGIGSVRDGLADILFPGTGTMQTRARYFLFVPWLYRSLERKLQSGRADRETIGRWVRSWENQLRRNLMKTEGHAGVIGSQAGDRLKRLPSSIYWQGVGSWGIRLLRDGQDTFHQALARLSPLRSRPMKDIGDDEMRDEPLKAWHTYPAPPPGFPERASFALTLQEAEYLRERILQRHRDSLLAWLLHHGSSWQDVEFAWDLESVNEMPPPLQDVLRHGRLFSELIQGAALVYNLMLAQAASQEDRISGFDARLAEWWEMVESTRAELSAWTLDDLWKWLQGGPTRVPTSTKAFVSCWLNLVRGARRGTDLALADASRDLIARREVQLKRSRARLKNPRALELWGGDAGTRQLDYRWFQAKKIVRDILEGLGDEVISA